MPYETLGPYNPTLELFKNLSEVETAPGAELTKARVNTMIILTYQGA